MVEGNLSTTKYLTTRLASKPNCPEVSNRRILALGLIWRPMFQLKSFERLFFFIKNLFFFFKSCSNRLLCISIDYIF